MQSNRLALVAPLSVILAAGGAFNFACSNSDDDDTTKADAGVYVDGGVQFGVPSGSGNTPPPGDDDDDTTPDGSPVGVTDSGPAKDSGPLPPAPDAGDSGGGGGTSPTTIAVLRLGDGTNALPGAETTAPTFVDFFKVADGTASGTSVSFGTTFSVVETALAGGMTLSTDGHFLAVGGFNSAPGTANAATLVRSIARINAAGTVDSTTISGGFTGSTSAYIRGVASVDGSGFWVTGTGTPNGTLYIPFADPGTGSVQLETSPGTTRDVGIFAGQLFISAATTTAPAFTGVGPVGMGTPKTTGQTDSVAALDATNPEGFVGLDTDTTAGADTMYVADGTSGVHKYKLSGTTWSEVGTAVAIGAGGARAVTGFVSGTAITVFATSDDGTVISAITDTTTSTTNGTAKTLVTAGTDKAFRGIAFAAK